MTYDLTEQSVQDAQRREFYEFRRNAKVWRFTSANEDLVSGGNTYTSATLSRSEIEVTIETPRNALTVTCAADFTIAGFFKPRPRSESISITVLREVEPGGEVAMIWKGLVLQAKWNDATAELHCEPVSVSADRPGLPRLCTKSCTYALFGDGCGLDKDDFKIDTTVSAISGKVITLAALLSYPYAGGWVEKVDADGNYDRAFIESASGTALTLDAPLPSVAESDTVTAYPGCDHTLETCDAIYNNLENNGAVAPYMAIKNPFSADPIF